MELIKTNNHVTSEQSYADTSQEPKFHYLKHQKSQQRNMLFHYSMAVRTEQAGLSILNTVHF